MAYGTELEINFGIGETGPYEIVKDGGSSFNAYFTPTDLVVQTYREPYKRGAITWPFIPAPGEIFNEKWSLKLTLRGAIEIDQNWGIQQIGWWKRPQDVPTLNFLGIYYYDFGTESAAIQAVDKFGNAYLGTYRYIGTGSFYWTLEYNRFYKKIIWREFNNVTGALVFEETLQLPPDFEIDIQEFGMLQHYGSGSATNYLEFSYKYLYAFATDVLTNALGEGGRIQVAPESRQIILDSASVNVEQQIMVEMDSVTELKPTMIPIVGRLVDSDPPWDPFYMTKYGLIAELDADPIIELKPTLEPTIDLSKTIPIISFTLIPEIDAEDQLRPPVYPLDIASDDFLIAVGDFGDWIKINDKPTKCLIRSLQNPMNRMDERQYFEGGIVLNPGDAVMYFPALVFLKVGAIITWGKLRYKVVAIDTIKIQLPIYKKAALRREEPPRPPTTIGIKQH